MTTSSGEASASSRWRYVAFEIVVIRHSSQCAPSRSPQRLAQILRERRKHDVETDADSLLFARVRVDGVLQVGRKYEHRAVLHSHDDLIGILSRELGNDRIELSRCHSA